MAKFSLLNVRHVMPSLSAFESMFSFVKRKLCSNMDHFAAPEGTERIIVPYLCIEEYDDGEFHSYPYRKGWTKAELNGANSFGNRSPLQVEAFFQTWLYFGFLKTVLRVAGIEVTTKDFVEELDNGEKVISTKVFPKVAQAWMDREGITISNSEDV